MDFPAILMLGVAVLTTSVQAAPPLRPVNLRCEYKISPIGIDQAQPRFSWQLLGGGRGRKQSAYQVLVADSLSALGANRGTLWDSGKTASGPTPWVTYAGEALQSRQQCWWKVRVWDENDRVSSWSEPASFEMGLLRPEDWQAKWIGYDSDVVDLNAAGIPDPKQARWMWFPEGEPATDAPAAPRWFRRTLELPENDPITDARLLVTVDDAAQLWFNGQVIGRGRPDIQGWNKVLHYPVADFLRSGVNVLAAQAVNHTGPAGLLLALRVTLKSGATVERFSGEDWKAANEAPLDAWREPGYDDSAWAAARVTAAFAGGPWTDTRMDTAAFSPVPHLRKTFTPGPDIRRATLYATALGIYEMLLNGKAVGNLYFAPGWTDYRERVYYHTYDVTALVKPDEPNALCALLANGWYAGHVGLKGPELYGTRARLMAQLEIEYADGRRERVVTDDSWRAAHGAIRGADLLMGEIHDPRKALPGWTAAAYNDADWAPVSVGTPEIVPERIEAYPGSPVKAFEVLTAKERTEPQPGIYVYDLGQNMVGKTRIRVHGNVGERMRVRHAEMLQENGMVYTEALRSALATNIYFPAGRTGEYFETTFTFHGFRYIEITGLAEAPAPEDVQGIVLHADIEQAAWFESSSQLLNQLFSNICWGLKGNYLEVPTDCPQRDERLGWTGDAQFFMPTALYTAGVGAFMTKWLVDLIQDSQMEDGSFAHVAPDVSLGGGAVAWGDAAIICPWLMYWFYGDTRIIERHYDNMIRGMDFLERTSENFIRRQLGFGDWLNLGGGAKDEVICTAYYAYLADLMARMGALIGRDEEAARYAELHRNIRDAFIEHFVGEDGSILESSQTGYALAFAFDLIPDELKPAAAGKFVGEIERFNWHLATGFIGTPRLLPALSLAGRDDVAYRLLMNTTYPSWLFQVTLGATTMWERWNGWTPTDGFADPSMNSFNHYAFGAVGEWIYSRVAGITPESPAFGRIRIAPRPGGGLSYARMTHQSIRGPIRSDWRIMGDRLILQVEIPVNTTAIVRVPTSDPASVLESGEPVHAVPGVMVLKSEEDALTCEIGSGVYSFEAAAPRML